LIVLGPFDWQKATKGDKDAENEKEDELELDEHKDEKVCFYCL
jgi:hypothetical protein